MITPQDKFEKCQNAVLNTLQTLLTEGNLGDDTEKGYVLSFITIVEIMDSQGRSRVIPLYNDGRTTVLLGLLNFGGILVQTGMSE